MSSKCRPRKQHWPFSSHDKPYQISSTRVCNRTNETGDWGPCRLIAFAGDFPPRVVGPQGACRSVGWSPDGSWTYFTASVEGPSRLWRQRFPGGEPEPLTSGPIEAEGIAVAQDGPRASPKRLSSCSDSAGLSQNLRLVRSR
jgi:hypothetical protein